MSYVCFAIVAAHPVFDSGMCGNFTLSPSHLLVCPIATELNRHRGMQLQQAYALALNIFHRTLEMAGAQFVFGRTVYVPKANTGTDRIGDVEVASADTDRIGDAAARHLVVVIKTPGRSKVQSWL